MPKPDMTREWCVSNSICELLLDLPVFSIGPSFLLSAEAERESSLGLTFCEE